MQADIRIIGAINEETYEDFALKMDVLERAAAKRKKPVTITLEITSDGGSVYSAFAFVARMRRSSLTVNTLVTGRVASAATLIAAAGAARFMTRESWMMVHEDSGEISGTVSQMEREIQHLRAMENQWNQMLAKFSKNKTSAQKWAKIHAQGDTDLSPAECVKLGLIDAII